MSDSPETQHSFRSFSRKSKPASSVSQNQYVRTKSTARGRLGFTRLFTKMDSTEEVAGWLREIGMSSYIPVFRAQAVTGNTLLSLNTVELRKTLGVTSLHDRRVLLEHVMYLKQTLSAETKASIPEDGRIMTHQSNEQLFIAWVRSCVTVQTVAMGAVRLLNVATKENEEEVRALAIVLAAMGTFAMFYATGKYYRINLMIDDPGPQHVPGRYFLMPPTLFVFVAVVTALYVLMAESTEEAAILALATV